MSDLTQVVTLCKVLHEAPSVAALADSSVDPDTRTAARFLAPLMAEGVPAFIENVAVRMKALQVEGRLLPLAVVEPHPNNTAYVASPMGQYIRYSREEMLSGSHYSRSLRWMARPAFAAIQAACRLTGFERVVFVNDWLLSSNLWPTLDTAMLPVMLHQLQHAFPDYAIVFRSVCERSEGALLQALREQGGLPVVSRQVYMLDTSDPSYRKKRPLQQDGKRWDKQTEYQAVWLSHADQETAARIRRLYEMVYLEKYSAYNPRYRERFIQLALESGCMDFQALQNRSSGRIDAVQAIFRRQGVVTTPFIGHDRSLPPQAGLYRHLNLLLTREAEATAGLLHMSSGAAQFKKQRGGVPDFEYNVAFIDHLGGWRRLPWRFWHRLSERRIKPGMQQYGV